MPTTRVDAVERSVQKTLMWLRDFAAELGSEDEEAAWRMLSAYLQVLRDRLTVDEAAQLAAQLPQLLRGVFWEGFDPGRQPDRIRDRETFLSRVAERAQLTHWADAAPVVAAATRVVRRHVSEGEVDDVLAQLPGEIRRTLEPA
jgi:uncharacterized protein (DUF2267 family)